MEIISFDDTSHRLIDRLIESVDDLTDELERLNDNLEDET